VYLMAALLSATAEKTQHLLGTWIWTPCFMFWIWRKPEK
jgi:hypothetical protein